MSDSDRPDLRALGYGIEAERWERMIGGIMGRAAFELQRRARLSAVRAPSAIENLVAWMRPALATAAVVAVLSLLALTRGPEGAPQPATYFGGGQLPTPV